MQKIYRVDKSLPNWRSDWLKERRKGIGGTDISAIVGLNPWSGALAVWHDKTSDKEIVEEENIPAELGLELENFLRRKFVKKFATYEGIEVKLEGMDWILADDEFRYFTVNIDDWFNHPIEGLSCGVELKTTTELKRKQWEGDNIPIYYIIQCQWGMMITGWTRWYIGFLIGNSSFDLKQIDRDEELIGRLRKAGKDFWNNYVIPKIPPMADGSSKSGEVIKELYPEEQKGMALELTEDLKIQLKLKLNGLDSLNEKKKELEKQIKENQNQIKQLMGESEYFEIDGRKVTFKTIFRKGYTVEETSYRMLDTGDKW